LPARGETDRSGKKGRHLCVDVHCHVHYVPADEMVKGSPARAGAGARFSSELTRATNRKQMQNVHACLTSVEQRLRDMDKMGVDVQAISVSPFQFMYSCPGARAKDRARHQREPGRDRPEAPASLRGPGQRAAAGPDAAAEELEYCVKTLGFRGVEIGTNVAGQEVSRGVTRSGPRCRSSTSWCSCTPTGSRAATGSPTITSSRIGNPLDSTVAVGYLVFDGVLERFPKLKIVVAHGGGYVAHYPARMDHVWTAREDARTVLKKKPRQSLAKLYFDTIVFDREQLRHLVNLWGAGHIVAAPTILRHGLVRSAGLRRGVDLPQGRRQGEDPRPERGEAPQARAPAPIGPGSGGRARGRGGDRTDPSVRRKTEVEGAVL